MPKKELMTEIAPNVRIYFWVTGFGWKCSDFQPTSDVFKDHELKSYAKVMGELFKPPADSEQMKLEFENRCHHPNLYFQDKKNLFDKHTPAEIRIK